MAQRILNVRVRPARVAVLIDRAAEPNDLFLAFEFLSRIWGGRFGQILAVDSKTCDPLTAFRLGESRPEFIYGIGLDDDYWGKTTREVCQPRGYGKLRPEFVKGIKQHHSEEYYLVDHALVHLFRTRDQSKGHKQALRLVTLDKASTLFAYVAATLGIPNQNLRKEYFDLKTSFLGTTTADFVELMMEFVKEWQQSWLDVTGHGLNQRIVGPTWGLGELPPTIVIVGEHVPDLSLFWNLRTPSDTTFPSWIIPIPAANANEAGVVEKIKEWLLAFLPYGSRPNYCQVTSQTVEGETCRDFAEQLQSALAGSPIEAVDFEPPRNRLPVVIPYEYEATWAVDISGRKLTIQPPKPMAFEDMGRPRSWFVDLLIDVKTGRAVKDLQLPSSPVAFELLNGPCPPTFEHTGIPRAGDGVDSINFRCSGNKEVVKVYLPTDEEILLEILRERNIEPIPDEKRSSYHPVIKRFGGLYLAASALSGQSGSILTAVADNTLTLEQIKSTCKLGGQDVAGETYLERIEPILQGESERMKRVARHRFLEFSKSSLPENLDPRSLLDHWINRDIVMRQWKVGPCRRCNQQYFVPAINIQRAIICRNCGNRIGLPAAVPIGYTLQRAVAHAIKEGVIPVAQTGRFLWGMSDQGFFCVPGVKYKIGDQPGDIDLLACCDGYLVFCECKSLQETRADAKVWDDVVAQFLETARIARLCNANLVVLASQTLGYPQAVVDRIKAGLSSSITIPLTHER